MIDAPPSVLLSVRIANGSIPLCPNATVVGTLDFEGLGSIMSLPENLHVDGDLLLRGTSVRSLPAGLSVSGSIELEGCKSLVSIQEGLIVGGDLDLEGCEAIAGLPKKFEVGGNLYLYGTRVSAIPETAIVRGKVFNLYE